MTRLRHYDNQGSARFITFSCYHNYNLLNSEVARRIFMDHLGQARKKYQFRLFGYVLMHNHVHIVLQPKENSRLGIIIGELKSRSAREIFRRWEEKGLKIFSKLTVNDGDNQRHAFWQKRFYDHNCRTMESAIEKINYCHNNPVKRGLVKEPGDWYWSSYRWYNGYEGAKIDIDDIKL